MNNNKTKNTESDATDAIGYVIGSVIVVVIQVAVLLVMVKLALVALRFIL